jgi:hypothetical protein
MGTIHLSSAEYDWTQSNINSLLKDKTIKDTLKNTLKALQTKLYSDEPIRLYYREARTLQRLAIFALTRSEAIMKIYRHRLAHGRGGTKKYIDKLEKRMELMNSIKRKVDLCLR